MLDQAQQSNVQVVYETQHWSIWAYFGTHIKAKQEGQRPKLSFCIPFGSCLLALIES
jgi:hypothetical protein